MANSGLTTDLSGITTKATAASSLANLILAIPLTSNPGSTKGYQPLNPPQPNGLPSTAALPNTLLFHYEGEQTTVLESDITAHYVENNTSIQDQIALRPEIITTKGFIGELNDILPSFLQPLQTIAKTLVTIDGYTPQLSVTALNKYNQAVLLYENAASIAQSAVGAWSSLAGLAGFGNDEVANGSGIYRSGLSFSQNKQQAMFQQFYGYWYNRTLFNVQTPWAIFTNMAIKTLRAIQDEQTRMITDFEITFMKIRTANTQISSGPLSLLSSGRAATQSTSSVDLGTSSGSSSSTSLGSSISLMA